MKFRNPFKPRHPKLPRHIRPIDIKGGKLTFGQRIELGKLYQSQVSEIEKFEQTFQILHQYTPKTRDYKSLINYFNQIIEGITHWIQQETTLLNYEPSAEEIQAGIKDLSEKIGEFGTVKALAKAYGTDPDAVYGWKYGKVFGILYTDLEEYKFSQRYNKVLERKHKI